MSDKKCVFCGSEKLKSKTPYMKPAKGKLGYENEEVFCCKAQAANSKYVTKRYDRDNRPDLDEVSKW